MWLGLPKRAPRIFLHRLEVNQHPTSRAAFNLTIQEELGDGGDMCQPPVFL